MFRLETSHICGHLTHHVTVMELQSRVPTTRFVHLMKKKIIVNVVMVELGKSSFRMKRSTKVI